MSQRQRHASYDAKAAALDAIYARLLRKAEQAEQQTDDSQEDGGEQS